MNRDREQLYARVTQIRVEAFELITELARQADDGDAAQMLALVRMQAVANGLGRIQTELFPERFEEPFSRRPDFPSSVERAQHHGDSRV